MSNIFQIPAILDGVTPLKDGGVSLRFHTNEASKSDKVMLMEFYQSFGYLLFSANQIEGANVPKANASRADGKSPSQRLRSVLYVAWQKNGNKGDFEAWYSMQVEKIIDQVKARIPNE